MTDDTRTQIALLHARVERLEQDKGDLEKQMAEMQRLDQSRMRAAVVALGAAVLGLGSYIWHGMMGGPRP